MNALALGEWAVRLFIQVHVQAHSAASTLSRQKKALHATTAALLMRGARLQHVELSETQSRPCLPMNEGNVGVEHKNACLCRTCVHEPKQRCYICLISSPFAHEEGLALRRLHVMPPQNFYELVGSPLRSPQSAMRPQIAISA